MRATGHDGELRVAYHVAAELGRWEIQLVSSASARVFQFRGEIAWSHRYWMTQMPFDLVLIVGTVEWIWRAVNPVRDGDTLTITLTARPEVSNRAPSLTTKG